MLKSPYSVEFRLHMEDWIQSLKELGKSDIMEKKILNTFSKFKNSLNTLVRIQCIFFMLIEQLLDLFERYQRMWAFLKKMFNETFFSVHRVDLVCVSLCHHSQTYLIFGVL